MSAVILEGKPIAERIRRQTRARAEALRARGVAPHLAMLRTARSAASDVYARGLAGACAEAGVRFSERRAEDGGPAGILRALADLNRDPSVHGILVEMPPPAGLDAAALSTAIDPVKDVERLGPTHRAAVLDGALDSLPCTAAAAIEMVLASGVPLAGAEAVVLGASDVVGKPVALALLARRATVTVCRSKTRDVAFHARRADILVAAVGKPGFVTGDMIKPGAVVVDVGINRVRTPEGKPRTVGDVAFAAARAAAGFLTPVPGGVGAVTSAVTLRNAVLAAEAATAAPPR